MAAEPVFPKVVIDESGINVPIYEDYYTWLRTVFQYVYGDDIYIEPDSLDGQFLAILALGFSNTATSIHAAYNAFSPATAQGNGLSSVVKINGIKRLGGQRSSVDLLIIGDVGATIVNGIVEDAAGNRWDLPSPVIIPVGNQIIVTATSQEYGAFAASANSITKIITPTAGWASVTNPNASSLGRLVESDAELRRRQAISTALPAISVSEGIEGAVASVPGVVRYKLYENDTGSTNSDGLPAHSMAIVVEGGDSNVIAEIISNRKTVGTRTYGTTSITVIDANGLGRQINFYRPTIVSITAVVEITTLSGYSSSIGNSIRDAIVRHINGHDIGADIIYTKLYVSANLAGPYAQPALPTDSNTFVVTAVKLVKTGEGDPTQADIPVLFNELISTDSSKVSVVAS